MARQLNENETKLLNVVQEEVPLSARPFATIAERVGLSEDEALDLLRQLRGGERPIIRQISAIFDTKALGYQTSLVAASVPEERLDAAAAMISAHPGVSHNYKRENRYNLWYTLAVPPDSKLGLEGTIDILHRESGATQTRLMPTLKLYKIGVKLNLGGEDVAARSDRPAFNEEDRDIATTLEITDVDKRMISVLQQDLPIEARPYDAWAKQAGVSVEELLDAAKRYQTQKRMRRFSAVLHHREAGFMSNGMGVWIVEPARQEEFGRTAASFSAVSHCYLRPTYPDWPYSMFTMVHAKSKEGCNEVMEAISKATNVTEYAALYSTKEYKKVRVKYFTKEAEQWEQAHAR